MALRNGSQWKPTQDIVQRAGGTVVPLSGQRGDTGRFNSSCQPERAVFYTVPARTAGTDFAI